MSKLEGTKGQCKRCGKHNFQTNSPVVLSENENEKTLLENHCKRYERESDKALTKLFECIDFFVDKSTERDKKKFRNKLEKYAKTEIYMIMSKIPVSDIYMRGKLLKDLCNVDISPEVFVEKSVIFITETLKKEKQLYLKYTPVMLYTFWRTKCLDQIYTHIKRLQDSLKFTTGLEFVINSLQIPLTYAFVYQVESTVLTISFEDGLQYYTDDIKLPLYGDREFPRLPSFEIPGVNPPPPPPPHEIRQYYVNNNRQMILVSPETPQFVKVGGGSFIPVNVYADVDSILSEVQRQYITKADGTRESIGLEVIRYIKPGNVYKQTLLFEVNPKDSKETPIRQQGHRFTV